jgi:hypothetical protein
MCSICIATLHRDLEAVPVLLEDLEVTITRQDRLADPSDRKSAETPLPLKLGPMEARRDLAATLLTWAYHLAFDHGTVGPMSSEKAARYLAASLDAIQRDEQAGDLADEIGYAVIQAQRAVDKPQQLQYTGPCEECGADLYAHLRASHVACRNCPQTYPIEQRREWLLTQAEDRLLTAAEMSRALPGLLRKPLTASMIRGWAHRDRLTAYPPLPERPRDPVYRVGDVLDLIRELQQGDVAC